MPIRKLMRIPKISTVAMLTLIAAGCNNSDASNDMSTDVNLTSDAAANDVLGANAMADNEAAAALPTDANGFATAVAASDLYEIQSGRLAAEKGSSADVKNFGQKLVADHEKSTVELKTAASQANVTVTPALDAEKQAMLDQLKGATGADFDRMFVDQQTTAHQKALSLLQSYSTGGDNQTLKGFASKATTVVQSHLDHLGGMKK